MRDVIFTMCVWGAALVVLPGCVRQAQTPEKRQEPVITGSAAARYAQGIRLLVHPDGSLNNPEEAYPWLLSAARKGFPNAQAMVGLCLQKGWGVEPNEQEAMAWYKKAARKGQSGAALQLAQSLRDSGSPDKAVEWLETALSKGRGTPEAHIMLASLKFRRHAERAAVSHLRYAALDGSAEAAYLMALCYEVGVGVPKDEQLMLGWLKNAADLGYAPAKELLSGLQQQAPKGKKTRPAGKSTPPNTPAR